MQIIKNFLNEYSFYNCLNRPTQSTIGNVVSKFKFTGSVCHPNLNEMQISPLSVSVCRKIVKVEVGLLQSTTCQILMCENRRNRPTQRTIRNVVNIFKFTGTVCHPNLDEMQKSPPSVSVCRKILKKRTRPFATHNLSNFALWQSLFPYKLHLTQRLKVNNPKTVLLSLNAL